MTTESSPNPNPASSTSAPAAGAPQPAHNARAANAPAPQSGMSSGDHDAAVRREAAENDAYVAPLSASEIKARAATLLNDPKSPYWQDGPDHAYAVALVYKSRELDTAAAAQAESVPATDAALSTTQRLANRNLNVNDVIGMPSVQLSPQDVEGDVGARNFIAWADREGVPTPTVRKMASAYFNALALGRGTISEQSLADMERQLGGELHPQQIALLKRWLREEVKVVR